MAHSPQMCLQHLTTVTTNTMRVNAKTAISTSKVLLVPYEAHHVLRYHGWMEDPEIQEATASEPLTLEEEYENQQSWRTSADKLTFIICQPVDAVTAMDLETVTAGKEDATARMVGDVNFFLYPDDEGEGEGTAATDEDGKQLLIGEVDVMIASKDDRRNGSGEGAVRALLLYLQRHISDVLSEYSSVNGKNVRLKSLMAKIKESNAGSRALFEKLGFKQQGEVNYFGEVKLVTDWIDGIEALDLAWAAAASDYTEVGYSSLAGQLT